MKAEIGFRWLVNLLATLLLVWGLKADYEMSFMILSLILAASFILMYNFKANKPKNVPWFNTTICYLAVCCFLALPGLMNLSQNVYGQIAILITVTGLLCLLDAYVPVIVYQLGYRSTNQPRYPSTLFVFIIAVLMAAVMIN